MRPDCKTWEDMRLIANTTTACKGRSRGRRKRQSKSMQHNCSSNLASMSSRRHFRKLLGISFKPVTVPLSTASSELPEAPARERCGGRYRQQGQRYFASQEVGKER